MKKVIAILLSLVTLPSISACSSKSGRSENNSLYEQVQTTGSAKASEPTKLTNKMTANEQQWINKHKLTLLHEFPKTNADPKAEHKVSIEFITVDLKNPTKHLNANRELFTDEEYDAEMKKLQKREENGSKYLFPNTVLVDGYILPWSIPAPDDFDDGGTFWFTMSEFNEKGESKLKKVSFHALGDYLEYIRKSGTEWNYSEEQIKLETAFTQIAFDALKSGEYETLPEGSVDRSDETKNLRTIFNNYRSDWEFDREAVEAIKDSVDEINIYDEELGKEFVVHVTLPPDYDKNKTYPVFFLTDGIWRFGNCPELRKCMENGEAAPVILVSLYYSYDVTDPDLEIRYVDLVINRELLLNFITDNLMPYLCENYHIDCENSTLYGHSDGGVFTHYALFNSDQHENQPFGHYIIGSPAFWGLYHENQYIGISNDNVLKDYGYFDRNEKLKKTVFLCAGSQEDPDYADRYREGDDTTLEGVSKLKERLESHNADLTYKLYDSHHYQYIPEMLIEYLKEKYSYK